MTGVQTGRTSDIERFYLSEQLKAEKLCLAKCGFYSNQLKDPELRGVLSQIVDVCQSHIQTLSGTAQKAGVNTMPS